MLRPDLEKIPDMPLFPGYFETVNTDDMLSDWVALLNKVFGSYAISRAAV